MNNFALVKNGVVQAIIQAIAASDYPDIANLLVPCGANVQSNWLYDGKSFSSPAAPTPADTITNKLLTYRDKADDLVAQIMAGNVLAGITTQQSDQMFDDFGDVLVRVKEGAWPTAIFRLQSKTPSGFVTQEMIDSWISTIQANM